MNPPFSHGNWKVHIKQDNHLEQARLVNKQPQIFQFLRKKEENIEVAEALAIPSHVAAITCEGMLSRENAQWANTIARYQIQPNGMMKLSNALYFLNCVFRLQNSHCGPCNHHSCAFMQ